MTLGEMIKGRRKEKGYTLRKVAEAIGVDHSFIAKIESGKKGASKEVLIQLADMLELDKSELLKMQGFESESKWIQLEEGFPNAVKVLHSANRDLDFMSKQAFEVVMVEAKQVLESDDIKQAIQSGDIDIKNLVNDTFRKTLLEALNKLKDEK